MIIKKNIFHNYLKESYQLLVAAIFCFTAFQTGCSAKPDFTQKEFQSWLAADQLFRQDSLWRGGDAAYSVDLGKGRVLWLFGDSFVGDGPDNTRNNRRMIRNSIGIQNGYDPTQATIHFYYGVEENKPTGFFPDRNDEWLWPGPGQKIGDVVLLTFTRLIQKEKGMFGFRVVGSEARFLINPLQDLTKWRTKVVPLPKTPEGTKFGTGALLLYENFLYAYLVIEPGNHDVYLARWKENDVAEMDITNPGWWNGSGWSESPNDACVIVRNLQTEYSVTQGFDDQFWMVSVDGFGSTNIVLRTAPEPEGTWSTPRIIFRPPESDRNDILVYSAKVYPYDRSQTFVFTYCTNHTDFWTMASDMNLYFPRFVRLVKQSR